MLPRCLISSTRGSYFLFFSLLPLFFGCGSDNGHSEFIDSPCVNTQIFDGVQCNSQSSPIVRVNISSLFGSGLCSGVVISSREILTAAHCLLAPLSLPTIDFTDGSNVAATNLRITERYLIDSIPAFDAAIIEIPEGIIDDQGITPLSLSSNTDLPEQGSIISVHGFGQTNDAKLLITPKSAFMVVVSNPGDGTFIAEPFSADGGGTTCEGDSGGPAIFEDSSGRPIVVGLVSEGETSSSCSEGSRTVFTGLFTLEVRDILPDFIG